MPRSAPPTAPARLLVTLLDAPTIQFPPTDDPDGRGAEGYDRGFYEEDDPPAGQKIVRVYNAARQRIVRSEIDLRYMTGARGALTHDIFRYWLDCVDPFRALRLRR